MSKIEIGEYVRTYKGYIRKVENYCDCKLNHLIINKAINGDIFLDRDNVVKHSKDIINLIEVGDFVNGHKIIMNVQTSKKHYNTQNEFVTAVGYTFANEDIKTILTKEQYEQSCYKLVEQ